MKDRIKRNEWQRQHRAKWKAAGLCPHCGSQTSFDRAYCDKCLERQKRYSDLSANKYTRLKFNAKKRGIVFTLTREEYLCWSESVPRKCHYCGVTEQMLRSTGRKKGLLTIDRKDNECGYSKENICLACHRCNNLKSNFFTESQWLDIASRYIVPQLNKYHCLEK